VQTFRKRRAGLSATAGLSCLYVLPFSNANVLANPMQQRYSATIILYIVTKFGEVEHHHYHMAQNGASGDCRSSWIWSHRK